MLRAAYIGQLFRFVLIPHLIDGKDKLDKFGMLFAVRNKS